MSNYINTDILIIGSGLAGLSVALSLPRDTKILLVTKDKIDACSTSWAQGGIAAVHYSNDDITDHIRDTIDTGHGLCNKKVVEEIIKQGKDSIEWLESNDIFFTRKKGEIDLTLEGGHSQRRICYIKDETGKYLHQGLIDKIKLRNNISILENTQIIDVITDELTGLKKCLGAYLYNRSTEKVSTIKSSHTIIATGGASKLYQYTTNPNTSTGDGIAVAWRAGCTISNMEFIQFHPTCLYHPQKKSFLISESLRGEGAKLLTKDMRPFMHKYDKREELAPRDIVARAIDNEMKTKDHEFVYLDISMKDKEFLKNRFPAIFEKCLEIGIDISKNPIPVVPASHYTCGGVQTKVSGETEINNLYVIGESAHTGFHGANRLASNSLLECIVMAKENADLIQKKLSSKGKGLDNALPEWDDSYVRESSEKFIINYNWDDLRKIMWNYVGIVRTQKNLNIALEKINLIEKEVNQYYQKYYISSGLLELRNIINVSKLIIKSALLRKESRGLHYSKDYPLFNNKYLHDTCLRGRRSDNSADFAKIKV